MVSTYWPFYMHEQFELDKRSHVSDRWGPLVVAVPEALDRLRRWLKSQERVVVPSVREIIQRGGSQAIRDGRMVALQPNERSAASSTAHCVVAQEIIGGGRIREGFGPLVPRLAAMRVPGCFLTRAHVESNRRREYPIGRGSVGDPRKVPLSAVHPLSLSLTT
jgi:hypothetical protein